MQLVSAILLSCLSFQNTFVPAYRQATDVVIIPIEGVVDTITAQSFKRRLSAIGEADALVIELNTPGGDLMSTLEICYEIKNNAPQNTIAWINPHAFSAGTIIALACREIVVATGSAFGDAAPVSATGQAIPATERAKIESPILAEVVDSARRNHYDENLVESFVSVGIELWLLENQKNGAHICVNEFEYESIFDSKPPKEFSPIGVVNTTKNPTLNPLFEALSNVTPTLDTDEPAWDPEFAQQLPSSRIKLGPKDALDWKLVKQIVPSDRLLTLKPSDGIRYGLVSGTIDNTQELKDWLGAKSIQTLTTNWSEKLVSVLISWPVRLALISLFLICIVVEFATGGAGLFGLGATASMALLIGAPWIAGLAQWWDVILVVSGLLLLAAEILIIPGTGFAGFAGAASLFAGMIGSFISGDFTSSLGQAQLLTGLITIIGGGFIAMIALWLILKHVNSTPTIRHLVLQNQLPRNIDKRRSTITKGKLGIAHTDLRPSGKIQVDNIIYDAVTTGNWITQGSNIRIMQTGMTIEVEKIES